MEETAISEIELNQFRTFGKPGRDPRGRTISVIYSGELINLNQKIKAGDDAKNLKWFHMNKLPEIAFDHKNIIQFYIKSKQ